MPGIHISDIENAINYWLEQDKTADGVGLSEPVRVLAEVYGQMVFAHAATVDDLPPQARAAWDVWYLTTPDSPCIAICSTSQGDEICKGCGRSFEEVSNWTAYTAEEKRAVWRKITHAGTAWRFNRYAERAALK